MAVEKAQNKMISKEEVKTKDYFFPDYQITVSATSQEEAEQKLSEIINKK
jgi:translation initiation factor 2 alpha subunit (eIF-2alpha)